MVRVNSETFPAAPSPEPIPSHSSRVLVKSTRVDSGYRSNDGLFPSRENMPGSIFGNNWDVSHVAIDGGRESVNWAMGSNRRVSNSSLLPQGLRNVPNYLVSNRAIASQAGGGSQLGKLSLMHNPKGYSNVHAEDMEILILNLQLKAENDKIIEGFGRFAEKLGKMYCCQSLGNNFFFLAKEILIFDEDICNQLYKDLKDGDFWRRKLFDGKWGYLFRYSTVKENNDMSDVLRGLPGYFNRIKSLKKPEILHNNLFVPMQFTWRTKAPHVVGVCIICYPSPDTKQTLSLSQMPQLQMLPETLSSLRILQSHMQHFFNTCYVDYLSDVSKSWHSKFLHIFAGLVKSDDLKEMLKHLR